MVLDYSDFSFSYARPVLNNGYADKNWLVPPMIRYAEATFLCIKHKQK